MKDKIKLYSYFKLMIGSIIVAVLSGLLAYTLKHLTTHWQDYLFEHVSQINHYLYIIFPSIGITIIYFLRKYVFQNKKNKGIREIYRSLDTRQDHLPLYKIPSHYINGFLTVIFGGSTGIEVSTVVATATLGNQMSKGGWAPMKYKRELICAGVTAGVAVLFGTVLGGWFFAIEVIARGLKKTVLLSCTIAGIVSSIGIYYFEKEPLLSFPVVEWHWYGLPFMMLVAVFGAVLATYFMKLVLTSKKLFARINSNFLRVNIGALTVGSFILFFPALYGDSYHGLQQMIKLSTASQGAVMIPISLLILVMLKPLVACCWGFFGYGSGIVLQYDFWFRFIDFKFCLGRCRFDISSCYSWSFHCLVLDLQYGSGCIYPTISSSNCSIDRLCSSKKDKPL